MPPKKRARLGSNATTKRPPIIFLSPGLKVDTRLKVFEQEFHVHSMILKLHSNFFRKFLDSQDKAGGPASALFQYEYVSVVDEDGTWALEPAAKAKVIQGREVQKRSALFDLWTEEDETEAFRKLLCAMYNRTYRIERPEELITITELADFYRALPIVSSTISGALLSSPMFKVGFYLPADDDTCCPFAFTSPTLIFAAQKLRHPVLFRECLIHIVSYWADILNGDSEDSDGSDDSDDSDDDEVPSFAKDERILSDPIITPLVQIEYGKVCKDALEIVSLLLQFAVTAPEASREWKPPKFEMAHIDGEQNSQYYRSLLNYFEKFKLRDDDEHDESLDDLKAGLEALLTNNLTLDQTGDRPGEGIYHSALLCADIADEDMPWDATETYW